jgi:exopolysaccharide biosynthesis protein
VRILIVIVKALTLVGCNLLSAPIATPPPPVSPTETLPTSQPQVEPGWEAVIPGIERRIMTPDGLGAFSQVIIHRFDPSVITFRAHLAEQSLRLGEWRNALPEAVAIINANFFDPEGRILGLLVSDGTPYGQSFVSRGGMFSVADGPPRIQSLVNVPYAGEALQSAVQAFPMLVIDRQPVRQNPAADRTSRRTVVAQDSQGRIIWFSTPLIGMTLDEMALFLSQSVELDIVQALNLDGGGSTMLYAEGADLPSFDPVPAVLAAYLAK